MNKYKLILIVIMILVSLQLFAVEYSYVSTRTLIVIYNNFQDGTSTATITDTDVTDTIEPAVDFFREFYWRNSHLKVNLEISYLTINTQIGYSDLSPNYLIDPVRVRDDLLAIDPVKYDSHQYGAVISIYALPIVPTGYYAATWPILDPTNGECTFGCIPSSKLDMLRDLLVHEYGHTLDIHNEFNSLPAYAYPHTLEYVNDGNTGPYSCFFDFHAGIVRDWPVSQWFSQPNFTWGVTRTTEDADNDGVPDNGVDGEGNPLAITELSLLTSTTSGDTDNDTLSDLDEVMAHYYTSSDPHNEHSDADGIPDGQDPYPIYKAQTLCEKSSSVIIDGVISTNEHHIANNFAESTHMAFTYLDWDNDNLYVSFQVISSAGVYNKRALFIYIDENADGLIQGNDNYVIYAGPLNDSILSIEAYKMKYGVDCEIEMRYMTHNITGAMTRAGNSLVIELEIPSTSPVGIDLYHSKKFGTQISYAAVAGDVDTETRQDLLTQRYDRDMEFLTIVLNDDSVTPGNQAPTVFAGVDTEITLPGNSVLLSGVVCDDGIPNPPASLTTLWSVPSSPPSSPPGSVVTFSDPNAPATQAFFSDPGSYLLRLTADDSEISCYDSVRVTVLPKPIITIHEEYQAEYASWNNAAVETEHSGFTGTGYVNTGNETGVYIEWQNIYIPCTTTGTLTFRYANDSLTDCNRQMTVTINGNPIPIPLDFITTNSWTNWSESISSQVPFISGNNTIRITAITEEGAPNVDRMDIDYIIE